MFNNKMITTLFLLIANFVAIWIVYILIFGTLAVCEPVDGSCPEGCKPPTEEEFLNIGMINKGEELYIGDDVYFENKYIYGYYEPRGYQRNLMSDEQWTLICIKPNE